MSKPPQVKLNSDFVYIIVVSWFSQCMGYVPREGCMHFQGRSLRKYIQHEGGIVSYPGLLPRGKTAWY